MPPTPYDFSNYQTGLSSFVGNALEGAKSVEEARQMNKRRKQEDEERERGMDQEDFILQEMQRAAGYGQPGSAAGPSGLPPGVQPYNPNAPIIRTGKSVALPNGGRDMLYRGNEGATGGDMLDRGGPRTPEPMIAGAPSAPNTPNMTSAIPGTGAPEGRVGGLRRWFGEKLENFQSGGFEPHQRDTYRKTGPSDREAAASEGYRFKREENDLEAKTRIRVAEIGARGHVNSAGRAENAQRISVARTMLDETGQKLQQARQAARLKPGDLMALKATDPMRAQEIEALRVQAPQLELQYQYWQGELGKLGGFAGAPTPIPDASSVDPNVLRRQMEEAIRRGADPAAVRARFDELTGNAARPAGGGAEW